eukprot:3211022-Rhodomonas_salina.1
MSDAKIAMVSRRSRIPTNLAYPYGCQHVVVLSSTGSTVPAQPHPAPQPPKNDPGLPDCVGCAVEGAVLLGDKAQSASLNEEERHSSWFHVMVLASLVSAVKQPGLRFRSAASTHIRFSGAMPEGDSEQMMEVPTTIVEGLAPAETDGKVATTVTENSHDLGNNVETISQDAAEESELEPQPDF